MAERLKLNWWCESCDLPDTPESGTKIRMLTSAPALTTNVYCEQPYCSADGNRLALHRSTEPNPAVLGDLLVYDIARYRIAHLQKDVSGIANNAWSGILFVTVGTGSDKRLVRFDLNTLEREDLFAWGDIPVGSVSCISSDQRYGIGGARTGKQCFGIFRVDLQNGECDLIHEGPYICNPHLQYRLVNPDRILVQENRGCVVDDDGNVTKPFDERGAGLYTIKADGTDRKDFPVGPPFTPGTTGHECWIEDTDHALVTLSATHSDGEKAGNVLEVRHEWEKGRVVFKSPHVWNHISATKCGRYFVVDSYQVPGVPILIGLIRTGKTQILCESKTTGGGGQYFKPDLSACRCDAG